MTFPIFGGKNPQNNKMHIPDPPKWRSFGGPFDTRQDKVQRHAPPMSADEVRKGKTFQTGDPSTQEGKERRKVIEHQVSAAIALRRPLLVTGNPGTGKSSLAYAISYDLGLGKPLRWNVTSRAMLKEGLYSYDALDRLNNASLRKPDEDSPAIDEYIKLGPLGTALLPTREPRVLLIDELDKSDIDLSNDLLNVFEEGMYEIGELVRSKQAEARVLPADYRIDAPEDRVTIHRGRVRCCAFPIVVITSNKEREFSPAFLRRCIPLHIEDPDEGTLKSIAEAHLEQQLNAGEFADFLTSWKAQRQKGVVATDQLLNALFVLRELTPDDPISEGERKELRNALMAPLEITGE